MALYSLPSAADVLLRITHSLHCLDSAVLINACNGLPADKIDFSSIPKFQRSLHYCVLAAS